MPINTPLSGAIDSSRKTFVGNFYKIGTLTANSDGSSTVLSFSNIPQNYNNLKLLYLCSSTDKECVYWNTLGTTSDYLDYIGLYNAPANTNTTSSLTGNISSTNVYSSTSSNFKIAHIDILNINSSTNYKSMQSFGGYDANGTGIYAVSNTVYYPNTNPITSLSLGVLNYGTLNAGTTATLYGII